MTTQTPNQEQDGRGYILFQLAKAFTTSEEHSDQQTRERGKARVEQWNKVFQGIVTGGINVGSRTPLKGIPEWVTLEIVTGGFSTGNLLAGGAWLPHEEALQSRLGIQIPSVDRQLLNSYFLTEDGLAELLELLESGCYKINYPEESVLLFVAWLVANGHTAIARELLEEISPFFSKLRFYPEPTTEPTISGSRVFLHTVKEALAAVRSIRNQAQIMAQKEAVLIWLPLYDRTAELFFETVNGDPPLLVDENGASRIVGGLPCQRYPDNWIERAQRVLLDYEVARRSNKLCRKPDKQKLSYAQLRQFMERCIIEPASLSTKELGRIRLILARYHAKHGLPSSNKCWQQRAEQISQVDRPTHQEIARVVIDRLSAYSLEGGLDDVEAIVKPITQDEANSFALLASIDIPASLVRKVERSRRDGIDSLIERGVITSGDTLARVLPQITAELKAAGISDPKLRRLYALNYRTFRKRRSLLLLNLESQVKIDELPWVKSINPIRSPNMADQELARQALQEIVVLTLLSFPQAILPNKLLQEIRTLIELAHLDIPIVDEIAADIFMGRFSDKYLQAAKLSSRILVGSLYARYYRIDDHKVQSLSQKMQTSRFLLWRTKAQNYGLAELCADRAGVSFGTWQPVLNGMIIEQQQILTTQNLAVLCVKLDLVDQLAPWWETMAQRVFGWILARLQVKTINMHARLIAIKNCAYAWRQMVFYLSQLPANQVANMLGWCSDQLNKEPESFQQLFKPALLGLMDVADSEAMWSVASQPEEQIFLGWSKHRHWLNTTET